MVRQRTSGRLEPVQTSAGRLNWNASFVSEKHQYLHLKLKQRQLFLRPHHVLLPRQLYILFLLQQRQSPPRQR